ncbi:MAG: hypothetical protein KME04_05545 [Pleurocapsa minor GSE-CHR-MK-17-07R]|jgi:hypothetical protein|nr:hypothetical protein [Pleurocapsa minor GSE-CHR-MK 17-07R]
MNKLFISTVFVGAALLGASALSAQTSDPTPVITLERTACFGTCPVYNVSILDDGTVLYDGGQFVDITGEQTAQIEPELVTQMVDAIVDAGYFDWADEYKTMLVSDLPYITTSVTRDGETQRIERYAGDTSAPLALAFIENWIDAVAGTARWTGASQGLSGILHGTESPVATLERSPDFGFGPVYWVSAYADGTVVYTGIANVPQIGVQVLQVDPLLVESVAMQADAIGYFGWREAYDQMAITDQATVITSVLWQDQFIRISRYEGDPTAPVGLLWIERSINALVPSQLAE